MGLSEGAGGALVKYGILAGLVIGGGLLIWNLVKDFKWPEFKIENIIPGGEQIKNVAETLDKPIVPDSPTDVSVLDIGSTLYPGGGIVTGLNVIWDMLTGSTAPGAPGSSPTNQGTVTYIPQDAVPAENTWVIPQDAAVLGGYLYQVGWVSEDANQQAYPLWKDKYSNELMVGWDVNYIRSLENLLLSDIRLGEEGRHNWSLM